MSKKSKLGDIDYEKPLQAILLAESFNDFFSPLTYEMPLALMPLANVPMIDYAIQWLSTQGVREIFVTFKNFKDQFEKHFKGLSWTVKNIDSSENSTEEYDIYPIIYLVPMKNISCQVDILKEIYERNLITSDIFLIMTAMSVTNFELKSILDLHQERHSRDSNSIITSIFEKASALHPIHRLNSDLVILLDKNTNQILGYSDDINISSASMNNVDIYTCPQIEVHNDLYDTYIDICSTEVLLNLVEINDYKDYHLDFLQDEINNNIIGTKYYLHILDHSYAGYVQDIRSYAQINRDILRRWTYPYTPEASFSPENQCVVSDQRIYYNQNIRKDYDTFIGPETLVGSNTKLIGNCRLVHCIMGHKNHIESDCVIEDSIIWNHNTINKSTTIKNTLIASNVTIGSNCNLANCIIGSNVVIGDNVVLKNSKIYRSDLYNPIDSESVNETMSIDLGEGGQGVLLISDDNVDICNDTIEEQRIGLNQTITKESLQGTVGFANDNIKDIIDTDVNKEKRFKAQIQEYIEECIKNNADINDTFTQMNCFKMAENKTYEDVLKVTVPAIINLTDFPLLETNINEYKKSTRLLLSKYETLIKRNVLDDKNRLSIIRSLQDYILEEKKELIPLFGFFLETLLNQNFINSHTILNWIDSINKDNSNIAILLEDPKVQSILDSINLYQGGDTQVVSDSDESESESDESSSSSEESEDENSSDDSDESSSSSSEESEDENSSDESSSSESNEDNDSDESNSSTSSNEESSDEENSSNSQDESDDDNDDNDNANTTTSSDDE